MNDSETPLVSICCITYNQKRYISQAIEGFLMQKINFAFEIIIYDDASTDGTTEIVREYSKRYPELIFPILQYRNQYSRGIRGITFRFALPKARGKYIALCEGDDYWTDPFKLQKQVDFLENHSDYGLIHTDNSRFYQSSKKSIRSNKHDINFIPPSGYVFKELLSRNFIPTLTAVVRKELLVTAYKKLLNESVYIVDYSIWLEIAKHAKIKYLDDVTAVYRVSDNTISRPSSKKTYMSWVNKLYSLIDYFLAHSDLNVDFVDLYRKDGIRVRLQQQYKSILFEKRFSYSPLHDMTLSYNPRGFYDKLLLFMYKKSCGRYCYLILKYFHFIFSLKKRFNNV